MESVSPAAKQHYEETIESVKATTGVFLKNRPVFHSFLDENGLYKESMRSQSYEFRVYTGELFVIEHSWKNEGYQLYVEQTWLGGGGTKTIRCFELDFDWSSDFGTLERWQRRSEDSKDRLSALELAVVKTFTANWTPLANASAGATLVIREKVKLELKDRQWTL